MKFTRENLDKGYNIRDLRIILQDMGGVPSDKNKQTLINEILEIQAGKIPEAKVKGRKSNREKFKEFESIEYIEDEFDDVKFENKPNGDDYVQNYFGDSFKVSGTFEKSELNEHGFLRGSNFKISPESDVHVSANAVRNFGLRCGDYIEGVATKSREVGAPTLSRIDKLNGKEFTSEIRRDFNSLEPIFPNERITLESDGDLSLRVIDLLCPIGKGQRGLIVSSPKAGKTTLIKKIASSIIKNHKGVYVLVVLIGERPEEVTDFKRSVNCDIVYSTFDDKAKNHVRISKIAIEKAKRLVELGKDVVVLFDSITRLVRACNETMPSSGKTLTGGIDPVAFQDPKSLFGSARNVDGQGSLTVIATALVETGSKMDDVIYEEFKGTGNLELFLSRELAEMRIFPSIDISRSGTRKDELLLSESEISVANSIRRNSFGKKLAEYDILNEMAKYDSNAKFIENYGKDL